MTDSKPAPEDLTDPCPSCQGKGEIVAPCVIRERGPNGPGILACHDCSGTGRIAAGYAERKVAGTSLKAARQTSGESLREFCKRTGENAVTRSRRERGIE